MTALTTNMAPQSMAGTETTSGTAGVPAEDLTARSIVATKATRATAGPSDTIPRPTGLTEARRWVADRHPWGDLTRFRAVAEGLSDAIKARISAVNRVERGGTADALYGPEMLAMAREQEERYREMLMDLYAQQIPGHVREWVTGIPGIASGELFPRLLGLLGHPRVAIPWRWEDRVLVPAGEPYERTVRELWSYCGCGDPERVPGKNASREELLAAGKRRQVRPLLYTFSSYLVLMHTRSEAVAGSKFYKICVEAKQAAQGNVHERQCQNHKRPPMRSNGCGTVAHPEWGEPGSPWRPGHIDMHAHRIVHKEFLRELWVVSGR
jgi:hypothetical protein